MAQSDRLYGCSLPDVLLQLTIQNITTSKLLLIINFLMICLSTGELNAQIHCYCQ